MKALKGTQLERFPLSELNKVSDLIHFDGPLLSLFRNREGDNYLYYWCDTEGGENRWLVFRVSDKELNLYLTKRVTLRDLIVSPGDGFVYAADMDADLHITNVYILDPHSLPSDYMPDDNSYYEFTPSSILVKEPAARGKVHETYKIVIDGDWTFRDLAEMPKIYSTVYAFVYSLRGLRTRAKDLLSYAYRTHPWRGGYSTLNFFNNLQSYIDPEHRLQIVSMQYASPGWIELDLLSPVAFSVKSIISSFVASADELEEQYAAIYREMRSRELLREVDLSSDDEAPSPHVALSREGRELGRPRKARRKRATRRQLSREDREFASNSARQIARLLKLETEDFDQVNSLTDNPLTTLKILLSVYRRIRDLAVYQIQGKVEY